MGRAEDDALSIRQGWDVESSVTLTPRASSQAQDIDALLTRRASKVSSSWARLRWTHTTSEDVVARGKSAWARNLVHARSPGPGAVWTICRHARGENRDLLVMKAGQRACDGRGAAATVYLQQGMVAESEHSAVGIEVGRVGIRRTTNEQQGRMAVSQWQQRR
jgi:hypothetical protein